VDEPIWIEKPEVLVAHGMQLSEHCGSEGIRDEGLLESALGKPRNVFAYAEDSSLYRLAASYAYGIARNRPFVDGNKRTALVVSEGFLRVNGIRIVSSPEEKYFTFLHLADGSLSEDELTAWFTQHAVSL
jgi:death-on-curing protein